MNDNQLTPQSPSDMGRRRFLVGLGSAGLLLAVWEIGRAMLRFLTPPLTQPRPEPVAAGSPHEFGLNTLTYIPAARAWLGYDELGYYAISAICPHLGCTIQKTEAAFACPCHGSQFDWQGKVRHGPATRPMTYLAVVLNEGILTIDPNQAVSSTTRLSVQL